MRHYVLTVLTCFAVLGPSVEVYGQNAYACADLARVRSQSAEYYERSGEQAHYAAYQNYSNAYQALCQNLPRTYATPTTGSNNSAALIGGTMAFLSVVALINNLNEREARDAHRQAVREKDVLGQLGKFYEDTYRNALTEKYLAERKAALEAELRRILSRRELFNPWCEKKADGSCEDVDGDPERFLKEVYEGICPGFDLESDSDDCNLPPEALRLAAKSSLAERANEEAEYEAMVLDVKDYEEIATQFDAGPDEWEGFAYLRYQEMLIKKMEERINERLEQLRREREQLEQQQ